MNYVYLNEYSNGCFYVGFHSWSGDGIDPDYNGSSAVAVANNWTPCKITILLVTDSINIYKDERNTIIAYCNQCGIADCAAKFSHPGWVGKFKPHGLMLNLHANSAEHLRSEENQRKSIEARKANGSWDRWHTTSHSKEVRNKAIQTARDRGTLQNSINAMNSKDAQAKARLTKIQNQSDQVGLQKRIASGGTTNWVESTHSPASIQKHQEYCRKNNSYQKANKTKRLRGSANNQPREVSVYKDDLFLMDGPVRTVCAKLGNPNWGLKVSRILAAGETIVKHHGYTFVYANF